MGDGAIAVSVHTDADDLALTSCFVSDPKALRKCTQRACDTCKCVRCVKRGTSTGGTSEQIERRARNFGRHCRKLLKNL